MNRFMLAGIRSEQLLVTLLSDSCRGRPGSNQLFRTLFTTQNNKMTEIEVKRVKTSLDDVSVKGEFVRKDAAFRNWITADGSSGFKAEPNRYHLYVCLACPWACRTLMVRKLKGLEDVISHTVVDWFMGPSGWTFTDKVNKCTPDPIFNAKALKEIYLKANPNYDGRFTVPTLWDKQKNTIVSNESSEILRMFNSEFNAFCPTEEQRQLDLYPESLRPQIDELNSWIYPLINNGVYRSGFATSQEAYDVAVREVFEGLDRTEAILSKHRFLTGPQLTEADIRLFTTLIRFDPVYHQHFKCNKKQLIDYPATWGFTRDIYQLPGIADTVDMEHIRNHYMVSHPSINPHRIVSIGPELDHNAPHGRENMS